MYASYTSHWHFNINCTIIHLLKAKRLWSSEVIFSWWHKKSGGWWKTWRTGKDELPCGAESTKSITGAPVKALKCVTKKQSTWINENYFSHVSSPVSYGIFWWRTNWKRVVTSLKDPFEFQSNLAFKGVFIFILWKLLELSEVLDQKRHPNFFCRCFRYGIKKTKK